MSISEKKLKIRDYKDLIVWQKSVELSILIYKINKKFPKEELFALSSQLKRSAVSIPSNIAEGSKRSGKRDFIQFLRIALGSVAELETQLLISKKLLFISDDIDYNKSIALADEISRMLNSLTSKLLARV